VQAIRVGGLVTLFSAFILKDHKTSTKFYSKIRVDLTNSTLYSTHYQHKQKCVKKMNVLPNKVVIVTGANSGIGHATVKIFMQQDAKAVCAEQRQNELETFVEVITKSD
jgi:NADPH:quinone reductase-like Zn-dependent oxidoreductase